MIRSLLRHYSNIIYQQRWRRNGSMHNKKRGEEREKVKLGIFIKQIKIFQFGL
jgi:hypothetical protein